MEDAFLHAIVEVATWNKRLILERPREIRSQVSSLNEWPDVLELHPICADIALRHESDFEEALAVLVWFCPRVGIGIVAHRAVFGEQFLALRCLRPVNLSKDLLRPLGRRQV